jgi:hypothetical protein
MPIPLEDWSRPHFRSGGGDAFLFYAIYGPTPESLSISRSRYRCDGIPDGLELMTYRTESHPEILNSFRSGYPWEELNRTDRTLAAETAAQSECLVIRGTVSDPADLNYLRNAIGAVSWLLDSGSVAVYDPQILKWWAKREWLDEVFSPASALPTRQTVILVSEDASGTEWFHTRGLRKFGRPDLSVHEVPSELRQGVIDLVNRFIEYQALGGVIEEGQEITLRDLPPGMTCTHRGSTDDPDFNNRHVEILWPK